MTFVFFLKSVSSINLFQYFNVKSSINAFTVILSGLDLSEIDNVGQNNRHMINFTGANLANVNFRGSYLENSTFDNANIENVDFIAGDVRFLFHSELIQQFGKPDLIAQCLQAKHDALQDSINRGNPTRSTNLPNSRMIVAS